MKIVITVKSGTCADGTHPVGQTFTLGATIPAGFCSGAWGAIFPYLMTLKYARMEGIIPPLNENPRIDEIVAIQVEWQIQMTEKYPNLMARARPVKDDAYGATSFATYLKGELETYSDSTLELLYRDNLNWKSEKKNMTEAIYYETVKRLGYKTLEDADRAAERQSHRR